MDPKKLADVAQEVVKDLGGIQNVPGAAQATGMIRDAMKQAKSKADAAGIGGVFDTLENAIENKVGMDLDGDGDTGAVQK